MNTICQPWDFQMVSPLRLNLLEATRLGHTHHLKNIEKMPPDRNQNVEIIGGGIFSGDVFWTPPPSNAYPYINLHEKATMTNLNLVYLTTVLNASKYMLAAWAKQNCSSVSSTCGTKQDGIHAVMSSEFELSQ